MVSELHKKTILLQSEHIRAKEKEITEVLRRLQASCESDDEVDELEFWIRINRLERYV